MRKRAASLREAFGDLGELDELVLFIDEVEEIAVNRAGASVTETGVTNELLKLIPNFREHDKRLLVCATNSVHALDSAFLRPGRFDYVIPVGPPDGPARSAVWQRYLGPVAGSVKAVAEAHGQGQAVRPAGQGGAVGAAQGSERGGRGVRVVVRHTPARGDGCFFSIESGDFREAAPGLRRSSRTRDAGIDIVLIQHGEGGEKGLLCIRFKARAETCFELGELRMRGEQGCPLLGCDIDGPVVSLMNRNLSAADTDAYDRSFDFV